MDCKEWRKQFKEWLNKYWLSNHTRTDIPDRLKSHAMNCKACNTRLKSSQILFHGKEFHKPIPEGLSGKITRYVLENHQEKKQSKISWILVPLAASALVLMTFFFTVTFFNRSDTVITIHLTIHVPDATSVSVVGDWNSWNPEADILSDPDGDGMWDIRLTLDRTREYRYQFVINGTEWIPDPTSPLQVDDGFGGTNSILEI